MLSIIIPFHNEKENLSILAEELKTSLDKLNEVYEIIFIDDGSTDNGGQAVRELSQKNKEIRLILNKKRFGKGESLAKGILDAKGDTIAFMDADLQDDPADISKFMTKLNEGYDLVNGIRVTRKENFIIKFYSKLGNSFLRFFVQSPFSDINCGFKVFKKEILKENTLYGNNFRFLPLAAYYTGFKVTEVKVNNRLRKYGKSKFGITKPFIGLIDTVTAYFLYRFSEKPLHFFGVIGGTSFSIGFIIALVLSYERIFYGILLYRRPALLFSILLIIVGIQIVMTGMIGELIVYLNKKKVS